jgi:hypothetical protein
LLPIIPVRKLLAAPSAVPPLSKEKQILKKLLSLALAGLLTTMIASVPASAQTPAGREPQQAEKVKAKVTRLGTGKQARVEIRLKDDKKLKGYIGEIAEEHFTLVDPKHGSVMQVSYEQVQQIKSTNHSAVTALLLGAGVIGGVMLLVVLSLRGS